jgi:hypothetical protein
MTDQQVNAFNRRLRAINRAIEAGTLSPNEATEKTMAPFNLCGRPVLNSTPHEIIFRYEDGSDIAVPPCGFLLNALPYEGIPLQDIIEGITLVTTAFEGTPEGRAWLATVPAGTLVLGSIIAAQAYPASTVIDAAGSARFLRYLKTGEQLPALVVALRSNLRTQVICIGLLLHDVSGGGFKRRTIIWICASLIVLSLWRGQYS